MNLKYLIGAGAAVVVIVLIALVVIYSGAANVAASAPHGAIDGWAFETAMRSSVKSRAARIQGPGQFSAEQVQAGFREFDSECAICHGAPGVERAEWATGLSPRPPNLARSAQRWDRAELFWIIQNGVKMTGMPAMGEHHSDEDIWSIVAFIETLPETSPEQYQDLRAARAHEAAPHSH
jgi:mono/diheme cytochrome c family protein